MAVSTAKRTSDVSSPRLMAGLAVSSLISAILLVAMGSIVRVTGNGLGCPDWPLCYGRVIPPALTGAWVEFTHRLIGGATSLQIILLGYLTWRDARHRRWVVVPGVAAVVLLAIQVSLGGLHVIFEIPPLTGLIHTGVAMLIVGLLAVLVVSAHPAMRRLQADAGRVLQNRRLLGWASFAAGAAYVLILTGSLVTRSGASLVCPGFPLCGASYSSTLTTIQMVHRYTAYSVVALVLGLSIWLLRQKHAGVNRVAYAIGGLAVVQVGLGMSNVLLRLPMWSRVLHLTVAAAIWAGLVILWGLCRVPREG